MAMQVQHIVWEDYNGGEVKGILDIEVIWHGGGRDKIIIQGTYDGHNDITNAVFGLMDFGNMVGVAGISVIRVGQFVD